MKIIDSVWFNEIGSIRPIGIVVYENDMKEIKIVIGTGRGYNQKIDEKDIAKRGAKFPFTEVINSIGEVIREAIRERNENNRNSRKMD